MKDKEKQIEEMAIAEMIQKYLNNNNIKVSNSLLPLHIASILIDNNYQKVDEDSVVLTSEQYSNYLITQTNNEWLKEQAEKLQADNERLYKNLGKFKQSVSKETAEKILKWLDNNCVFGGFEVVKTWFKEQFGVEIKEN